MKISFVIPCYRSQKTLAGVIHEVQETMATLNGYTYEIILVNDASPDDTFSEIRRLCKENDNIIGIDMAKNFGQHSALMAGFHEVSGEIVVCLDDDGQTPANEVGKLLDKINEGYDVVYAEYANKRHSKFRNFGSHLNSIMTEQLLEKPKDLYLSSYFAVRRFIVEEMIRYDNAYPYITGLVLRSTKNICNVEVKHREREVGESGYSLSKLLGLWLNGFTSFSVKPLRLATFSGLFAAFLGVVFIIVTVIRRLIDQNIPIGWSSTISVILLMGGMILFVLGIIGEYIGRIYICINHSPQYVIREKIKH
jgi:sugar transferase